MSGVCPRPIHKNEPVYKRKRGNEYAAPESPESPEAPEEDPTMADQGATAEHINDENMFVGKLHEVEISGFAAIGGTDCKLTGIVTVKWSWKY